MHTLYLLHTDPATSPFAWARMRSHAPACLLKYLRTVFDPSPAKSKKVMRSTRTIEMRKGLLPILDPVWSHDKGVEWEKRDTIIRGIVGGQKLLLNYFFLIFFFLEH